MVAIMPSKLLSVVLGQHITLPLYSHVKMSSRCTAIEIYRGNLKWISNNPAGVTSHLGGGGEGKKIILHSLSWRFVYFGSFFC